MGRSFGAGVETSGARPVAGDSFRFERAVHPPAFGVGRAETARHELRVSVACELAAALERGKTRGGTGRATRIPTRPAFGQCAHLPAPDAIMGKARARGGYRERHALFRVIKRGATQTRAALASHRISSER